MRYSTWILAYSPIEGLVPFSCKLTEPVWWILQRYLVTVCYRPLFWNVSESSMLFNVVFTSSHLQLHVKSQRSLQQGGDAASAVLIFVWRELQKTLLFVMLYMPRSTIFRAYFWCSWKNRLYLWKVQSTTRRSKFKICSFQCQKHNTCRNNVSIEGFFAELLEPFFHQFLCAGPQQLRSGVILYLLKSVLLSVLPR